MTVDERITLLKLAIGDALDILRDGEISVTLTDETYRVAAFKQVLNQMVYARIEEWGENQVDVAPEVRGIVEDAAKARSS